MKLSQFEFDLPEKLIADFPSDERDESRLMVVHRETGEIEHKVFKDVLDYLMMEILWSSMILVFFLQECMETKKNGCKNRSFSIKRAK